MFGDREAGCSVLARSIGFCLALLGRHKLTNTVFGRSAGKTSMLCHLANVAEANKGVVKSVGTAPTIGTQMVEFRRRNVRWIAWDMSGQGV